MDSPSFRPFKLLPRIKYDSHAIVFTGREPKLILSPYLAHRIATSCEGCVVSAGAAPYLLGERLREGYDPSRLSGSKPDQGTILLGGADHRNRALASGPGACAWSVCLVSLTRFELVFAP